MGCYSGSLRLRGVLRSREWGQSGRERSDEGVQAPLAAQARPNAINLASLVGRMLDVRSTSLMDRADPRSIDAVGASSGADADNAP